MMHLSNKNPRGFTLIEMLVSIALFATIMTMALGALLALSVADRRAEALKSAMDNLTFALDSMSRSIRTGSTYHCGAGGIAGSQQDCSSGTYLTYVTATGSRVYYQFDTSDTNCGAGYTGCIERSTDGTNWFPITSPDLAVTGGSFTVVGASATLQPTVFINVTGTVTINGTQQNTFYMQTDVTQRIYDL